MELNIQKLCKYLKDFDFFYSAIIGLCFAHTATAIFWIQNQIWDYYNNDYFKSACYTFFESCTQISFSNTIYIKTLVGIYLFLSVLIYIPILLNRKNITYFIFSFLFFIKCIVFLSRYNLMGNYHTMHLALIIAFLLYPKSSPFYRIAICLQYFWAGTLKLNIEWLSGAALLRYPGFFKDELFLISLSYVVVLEIILSWGLLSKNIVIRRLTLLQLLVFHCYSYFIVGWFYPSVMLGILFPILVEDFFSLKKFSIFKNLNFKSYKHIPVSIFLVIFCAYNLSVKFSVIDPAKDGAIRSLSLNMLDAKTTCNTKLIQKFQDSSIRTLIIPTLERSIRVKCDPVVFKSYLKKLCFEITKEDTKSELFFHLETRRQTDKKFDVIRQEWNICEN